MTGQPSRTHIVVAATCFADADPAIRIAVSLARRLDGDIRALLERALRRRSVGRYQLEAAISALHSEASSYEETDFAEIVGLYDLLVEAYPTPVVRLNRAVALAAFTGPEDGLIELDSLGEELADYQPWYAARADLLARAGRHEDAEVMYREAISRSTADEQRTFLERRLDGLSR